MMKLYCKTLVVFIISAIFVGGVLPAHGKKDVEEKYSSTLESWQETFDINNKKKGKYNIFVTANDFGGNRTVVGPYNMYVDPESDKPICGITNPTQDMRVVGNLNIVGTCFDDDAVQYVELVFDGDDENPVRAKGQEFWSYYLDTHDLEEGPHSIKVTGYDINGLASNPLVLSWNLDRRQPVTLVTSNMMGDLVSGTVKFSGNVSDGNGVKYLYYSIDGGQTFFDVKLKNNKDGTKDFIISVDSRKFSDGPQVLWFKAVDLAGSEGIYSFLYFVDNTKPEVSILYPAAESEMNGKFLIAGMAKDILGLKSLKWTFGSESGDYELIPGNPYWGVLCDTTGSTDKSRKFEVMVQDLAGNIITVNQLINLNQDGDKPVVEITEPAANSSVSAEDSVFVRGIAHDDDGVSLIRYKLDNGEWVEQKTKGTFYAELCRGSDLSAGSHTVSVVAVDKNGVQGNPVSVSFKSSGGFPVFSPAKIGGEEFKNGMIIHPESGKTFQTSVSSSLGISTVHYEITWGAGGIISNDITPKSANAPVDISIPISPDFPKGVVKVDITATDTVGRTSNYKALLDIINTSVLQYTSPAIVLDDSRIDENGVIINNEEFPASAYFIGGNAKSVQLVPATEFARAELVGNSIKLIAGKAVGSSAPVVIRVITDQGLSYESRKITFKNDNVVPVITINNASDSTAIDGTTGPVTISGSVESASGVGRLSYRIFGATAILSADSIVGLNPVSRSELNDLKAGRSFSFSFNPADLEPGFYIVEVIAESAGGNKASAAVAVKNIPAFDLGEGAKAPVIKAPMIFWADGEDVYYGAVYQGNLDKDFGVFKRANLAGGANSLTASVTPEGGKPVQSKFNAVKAPELKAFFAKVGENDYLSGTPIVLQKGETGKLTAYIDTNVTVTGANFEFSGAETPGGSVSGSGKAVLTKSTDVTNRWIAEIPLSNMPVRINKVKLSIQAGGVFQSISGSVAVVRPPVADRIDDDKSVYVMAGSGVVYDKDSSNYILAKDSILYFYANTPAISTASLVTPVNGLNMETDGNIIAITALNEGRYSSVQVKVRDENGISYNSRSVNLIVDYGAPTITIASPELQEWRKQSLRISGSAQDNSGIKSGEYSIDGGETWKSLNMSVSKGAVSATFNSTVDLQDIEDGIIRVDLRIFDTAGNVSYARTVVHKDTIAPEVKVIVPNEDAVVNGTNLIAFLAQDNGYFDRASYVSPSTSKGGSKKVDIDSDNYMITLVGTEEKPIDAGMSFQFADSAGNISTVSSWAFRVKNETDLPISEIHLPIENEVITKDFTISGVVYDDDGPSTIYYRIDNGEYQKLSEMGTSFSISVPFSSMKDNEHKISIYAVDINGVKGPVAERSFRVSTEEPKGLLLTPDISSSVKDVVTITGTASDNNGIAKVQISLNNGNTYNDVLGTEKWSYTFDSRVVANGTHVVFIKIFDKYGIQGLYSSLINIDNENPEISLDFPLDYSSTTGPVFFSGSAFDNVEITELYVKIYSLEQKSVPRGMQRIDFSLDQIIAENIDLSILENGSYNLELTALDKAKNATYTSRNIILNKNKPLATIDILYPLNGQERNGNFYIYGQASADKPIETLSLYIDNKFVADTHLKSTGYYKFPVTSDIIETGVHTYRVDARVEGGSVIRSREQTITYSNTGPWISIEKFSYGDFAVDRPFVAGQAGYNLSEEDIALLDSKDTPKEIKNRILKKKVSKVEISFNNGKTFTQISKGSKWAYRIENQDISEGLHFLLIRAVMENGEYTTTRTIVQVDNTPPKIHLISPGAGGYYNQELTFSGLSSDNVGMQDISFTLRKGDKASYELPSFIQGLYVDTKFWGATLFDIGIGLTFFNDVVKVQFQFGQFTQPQRELFSKTDMRYGGDAVLGLKILANVATIPFSSFLGRDWEWLSANFALGANFTRFNETNSDVPQFLSALIGQVEFPKVTFKKAKALSSFAFYTEVSLWFIPTDVSVSGGSAIKNLIPQFSEGFRISIF